MSFGGLDFIFDGQYSGNYGLKIMSFSSSLSTESSAGCGIEIFEDSVYRNPTVYHQGVSQNQPLEFDIEFVSEDEIPSVMRSKISKWLFSRMNYCKLQIIQRDLQDIYFNCHLVDPIFTYIGNYCHGISCKVKCDAPWAWQNQKTFTKVLTDEDRETTNPVLWRHYNDSDDTDYTYPLIEFTTISAGDYSIVNENDNNREFRFEGLQANETIKVDCRNQTIESSMRILRSKNFIKKFFRLVSGVNNLKLSGAFESLTIKYKNARKVGG